MKIRKRKKLIQKLIISFIMCFMSFYFVAPVQSQAKTVLEGLYEPIQLFTVAIGDTFMKILQIAFTGTDHVTVKVSPNYTDDVYWTIPDSEFLWTTNSTEEEPNPKKGVVWKAFATNVDKAKVRVPTIEISPESIFSGKIPAFDINFFNPDKEGKVYSNGKYELEDLGDSGLVFCITTNAANAAMDEKWEYSENVEGVENRIEQELTKRGWVNKETGIRHNNWEHKDLVYMYYNETNKTAEWRWIKVAGETEYECVLQYSYEIEGNERANLIYYKRVYNERSSGVKQSTAFLLQPTISYWYNLLKNISIIGLLSVLVYIGIRIVLSSSIETKSKYKELLKDWLIALCLLFFMHYFMNFIVSITEYISETLESSGTLVVQENGVTLRDHQDDQTGVHYLGDELIGMVRIRLQAGDLLQHIAYTIIYIVLIIYTFIFAFMYIKRVLYMAFFTMIAPLVALTYPIDKLRDGKAQAFDMWMKEYTLNAILQPFHLLLYYILVSSAINMAKDNVIYAIVAIGFIMPAEKLLRKFFGLNGAKTASALSGALGGAIAMKGMQAITNKFAKGNSKYGSQGENTNKNQKIRMSNAPGYDRNTLIAQAARYGNMNMRQINNRRIQNINRNNGQGRFDFDELNISNIPARNAARERLDELISQGFGPGDELYDTALNELNLFNNPIDEFNSSYEGMDNTSFDMNFDGRGGFEYGNEMTGDIGEYGEFDSLYDGDNSIGIDIDNNADEQQDTQTEDVDKYRRIKGFVGTSLKYAGKGTLAGLKLGAKATGAATLGTIGVAAGLASENYSNAVTWGLAGMGAGSMATEATINKAFDTVENVKDKITEVGREYEKNMHTTEELKVIEYKREKVRFMKNPENIKLYKEKFGNNYERAMQAAQKYRDYGIDDNDKIIKAMKLKTKGLTGWDDKRRILIAATASDIGRKDVEEYGERLVKRGFGRQSAEIMKKAIREFNEFE